MRTWQYLNTTDVAFTQGCFVIGCMVATISDMEGSCEETGLFYRRILIRSDSDDRGAGGRAAAGGFRAVRGRQRCGQSCEHRGRYAAL